MEVRHGEFHLLDYWKILVQRRWVVILAVVSVVLVALIGAFVATPLYRARATLLIERQRTTVFLTTDLKI